jgi:hypothetical protein
MRDRGERAKSEPAKIGEPAGLELAAEVDQAPELDQQSAAVDETPASSEPPVPVAAVQRVAEGAGEVLGSALGAGERIADLGQPVADRVRTTARAAARRWRSSRRSRLRYMRKLGREPLPNLFEIHPEARMAPRRELGLRSIPVDEVRGSAVEGPAQRGTDFLPLPPFRSANWIARWRRIRDAVDRMAVLPPIDVLKTADGYWVVDGHNRVAAALYAGQLEIDALVTAVRLPGETVEQVQPDEGAAGSLEAMLADADELRAAGTGMLTPGASLEAPLRLPPPPSPDTPDETDPEEKSPAPPDGTESAT